MRQVQLHEEEQQFAALVAEAEAGESLTILRHGKPVAQIIPFPTNERLNPDREAARKEWLAIMQKGIPMGGVPPTRDEMHER